MKRSTAYRQAKASIRFLSVAVPCVWGLFFWTGAWPVAGFAIFMSLYLLMDALLVARMKKAAKNDPEYFKKKLPGT